jgi:serine/threonine protein phosphatase 1
MQKAFAIGDIHGCAKTFKALIHNELKLSSGDVLYLLGDLIDRGPDTKAVIDEVFYLRQIGIVVHVLRGNHEDIMLKARNSDRAHKFWVECGGDEVLKSFGVNHISEIPLNYIQFIEQSLLILYHQPFYFVHAGLDFTLSDPLSGTDAMMWIRKMQVNKHWLGPNIIIHGHTPESVSDIKNQKGPVYNLDGGCVYTEKPGLGYLVAMDMHSGNIQAIKNSDMDF